jgi:hypothetical protein
MSGQQCVRFRAGIASCSGPAPIGPERYIWRLSGNIWLDRIGCLAVASSEIEQDLVVNAHAQVPQRVMFDAIGPVTGLGGLHQRPGLVGAPTTEIEGRGNCGGADEKQPLRAAEENAGNCGSQC